MTTSDKNIKLRILARQFGVVSNRLDNIQNFRTDAEYQLARASAFLENVRAKNGDEWDLDQQKSIECWEQLWSMSDDTMTQCDTEIGLCDQRIGALRDQMFELKERGAVIEPVIKPSKPAVQGDLLDASPTGALTRKQREAGWETWGGAELKISNERGSFKLTPKVPIRFSVKHADRPGEFAIQALKPLPAVKMGEKCKAKIGATIDVLEYCANGHFDYQGEALSFRDPLDDPDMNDPACSTLVIRGRYDVNSRIAGGESQIRNLLLCWNIDGESFLVDHNTINKIVEETYRKEPYFKQRMENVFNRVKPDLTWN